MSACGPKRTWGERGILKSLWPPTRDGHRVLAHAAKIFDAMHSFQFRNPISRRF